MFICNKCGKLYEEYPVNGCCSDYDVSNAKKCKNCDEYESENKVYNGVCMSCIKEWVNEHSENIHDVDLYDVANGILR